MVYLSIARPFLATRKTFGPTRLEDTNTHPSGRWNTREGFSLCCHEYCWLSWLQGGIQHVAGRHALLLGERHALRPHRLFPGARTGEQMPVVHAIGVIAAELTHQVVFTIKLTKRLLSTTGKKLFGISTAGGTTELWN